MGFLTKLSYSYKTGSIKQNALANKVWKPSTLEY